jgi:hypothetical protein
VNVRKLAASAALAALPLLTIAPAALADPSGQVQFSNESSSYLWHVYVSPATQSDWGRDLLGSDVLAPGDVLNITFNPAAGYNCRFDILLIDEDGYRTERSNVNLCAIGVEHYTD